MGKFLLVIAVFAVLVYGVFWLLDRRRRKKHLRAHSTPPKPLKRQLGPDDDEDFLRELEQRRRRAAREQEKKDKKDKKDEDPLGKDQSKPE